MTRPFRTFVFPSTWGPKPAAGVPAASAADFLPDTSGAACWPQILNTYLLILLLAGADAAAEPTFALAQGFLQPPASARPWVNWIWLNGNITSNGITADLEAMRRVGIGGVMLMEVDYDTPKGPVAFGSPAWRGLFKHLCAESDRLGVQIKMNNDAGYCGSGGPWITPELSMQKLVWSETSFKGVARFDGFLAQPETVEGFYRDIAVLAFPTPVDDAPAMTDAAPRLTANPGALEFEPRHLIDEDTHSVVKLPQPAPENPSFVQVEFASLFRARQLTLKMPLVGDQIVHGFLQASDDGTAFRTVREFDVIPSTPVFNFPEITARYFRVLFPTKNADVEQFVISELELSPRLRIEGIEAKALFTRKHAYPGPSEFPGQARYAEPGPGLAIRRDGMIDLTAQMNADGRLRWEPPPGSWTVLRIGHTSTGKKNHPAPEAGTGLECDKLSKAATEAAFEGLMGKLVADVKPLVGKALVSTHIDSWEVGSQNWTADFPAEFRRRRGYDLLRFLPVMTGRVVESMEISERFLWDLRQTVSEMLADNYAGHMRALAHRHGLALSIEAYDGPSDDLTYAGRADEPMAEFWTWPAFEMNYTCTEMSSAAHVYGKRIVAAEAFTAMDAEKWLGHPFAIKAFGDWAFCEGLNRFVIHRYALQPWTDPTRLPGMAFGPFGIHFERTETWWEQARAWSDYLARCQFLLQQGLFVADICYLAPEMAPRRWRNPNPAGLRDGYNFDACPAEVLFNRMSVKKGKLVLPDGMSYRLLALPETETMTPELLVRIRDLAAAGATVVGSPPLKSPSLADYPRCDAAVTRLAREIWGDFDGKAVTDRRLGKGRVIRGLTPHEVLARSGLPPDFEAHTTSSAPNLHYTHRSLPNAELYFVANKALVTEEAICSFRVANARPELWWPDTGRIEQPAVYAAEKTVRVPLRLGPAGSVFVVFRKGAKPDRDRIKTVRSGDETILSTQPKSAVKPEPALPEATNNFTIAFWVKPEAATTLPEEAVFGKGNYFKPRNDALYPLLGHFMYHSPDHAGVGISVGTNGVWVIECSADYWGSPLVHAVALTNWTHVAVVYESARPRLYLNGRLVHEGLQSPLVVHCSVGVPQRRSSAPFIGDLGRLHHVHQALNESAVAQLRASMPVPVIPSVSPTIEIRSGPRRRVEAEIWEPGEYVAETASGQQWRFNLPSLPKPLELAGPWQVTFAPGWGAPPRTEFERLISWSNHSDEGIRHFSGSAVYARTFRLPRDWVGAGRRVYLDLGKVAIMADVTLNGRALGTLWKAPFRVEITGAVRPGENQLEVTVANLWINRMIGDESLPEDSLRHAKGSLKEWPQWLQEGKPSPTGRFTFTTYRLWSKDSPLQDSGLLGPVTIIPTASVTLSR